LACPTATSKKLLAERGIEVDHVTIYRWVQRFTLLLVEAARPCRHVVGDRWQVDETYVKVAGQWRYVYRAIDQFGRSSMCSSPLGEMPRPPTGSSSWPSARQGPARRGHHRSGAGVPSGTRACFSDRCGTGRAGHAAR
jgi:hypothetical protein